VHPFISADTLGTDLPLRVSFHRLWGAPVLHPLSLVRLIPRTPYFLPQTNFSSPTDNTKWKRLSRGSPS